MSQRSSPLQLSTTFSARFLVDGLSLSSLQLSDFFEAIEGSKAALAISDYSISQTTLEQVFISFVNNS
jgi:hypothetical protein